MSTRIRAGFATTELPTPPVGFLAGYAVTKRSATGTSMPLTATIARFTIPPTSSDAACDLVWVGIDALAIGAALHAAICTAVQARLPGAETLVSATHTHSAPGAWCGSIHPILPATIDVEQIANVAEQIGRSLPPTEPVELSLGVGQVEGVGTDRHDPRRPVDTSVGVLAARRAGGIIGVVVDHACHPTVLGRSNTLWSPDWVSGLRAGLREALGISVPVLFLQGAAGDVSTRFTRAESSPREADRLGRLVAAGAADALASALPMARGEGLKVARHRLRIRRRDAVRELRAAGVRITAGACGETETDAARRVLSSQREGIAALDALAQNPGSPVLEATVADVRIAGARYLTTPFELQNDLGNALARAGRLRVVGYTDGYLGYLCGSEAHAQGVYEATSSYLDAEESESLMARLTDLISPTKGDTR